MMTDRLPFEPKERAEAWNNGTLGCNYETIVIYLASVRASALPSGPADSIAADISPEELRASIALLALVSPAPAESPDEVVFLFSSLHCLG